jgi:hypothetical protein
MVTVHGTPTARYRCQTAPPQGTAPPTNGTPMGETVPGPTPIQATVAAARTAPPTTLGAPRCVTTRRAISGPPAAAGQGNPASSSLETPCVASAAPRAVEPTANAVIAGAPASARRAHSVWAQADTRVCTVPAESGCAPGERDICPVPWLCGSDGFCRNECPASGCPAGYVCQPEVNVCADATGDEVTSDGGPGCQHETCDLWPQCGCGPDQGCDLGPNLERRCVRAGTTVSGEIPTQDNPCALGFTASKPSDWVNNLPAVCYHFCNADHECRDNVGTRSRCTNYLTIESVTFLNIRVCSLDCDPITPSASGGCLEYTHCRLHYDLSQPELTRTDCLAGHGRSLTDSGGSCSAHHNCTPSTTCHEGFCRRLCTETSPPGTCSPGTHCEPLEPTIRLGDETYGVCLP